jgi:hypothetical protein
MLITSGFKSNIFHHLTVFTPGSMNKNNNGLWFSADNFFALERNKFSIGQNRMELLQSRRKV